MNNDIFFNQDRVIDCPDQVPDWDSPDLRARAGRVVKIVLGQLGDDDKKLTLTELPADFATLFPNLTHLYLWKLAGLTKLPALPPELRCLDVRGCGDLAELPALPGTLETLDLGGCAGLKKLPQAALPHLARFHFNGCMALKLGYFLGDLADSPLVEIDGSGSTAVVSLEEFPKKMLRKLVLKGCVELADAKHIAEFVELDHLNLAGCTALTSLPDLPPNIRYLELFGANALKNFVGQSLAAYDLGTGTGLRQNVAKAFKTRKKFGGELAIMPHAKLLLMGDGRVGKTTLAKRLQWDELSPREQALPDEQAAKKPRSDEPYTHKVQFSAWSTGLKLAPGKRAELEGGARRFGLALPKTAEDNLAGTIRIWDFGGQEIYHSTHRVFAGEGSVFLVVWRPNAVPPGPKPDGVDEIEWGEWNRRHSLDYWFDYIFSLRNDAKLALVCTGCGDIDLNSAKPNWRGERAPKYSAIEGFEPQEFFVDSLAHKPSTDMELRRLVDWIRTACGSEAARIGILQPMFYCRVAGMVASWLIENEMAHRQTSEPRHLITNWSEWVACVTKIYEANRPATGAILTEDDVVSVTTYLHDAGQVFHLTGRAGSPVLIDQKWATDLIYRLLKPGLDGDRVLWNRVRLHGGWFYGEDLETDEVWHKLTGDQQLRLLGYMEECEIVTRIGRAETETNLFCHNVYLATDKWLLPTYESVRVVAERDLEVVRTQEGFEERQKVEFEKFTLSEFEFRKLQSKLARVLGSRATYFRNGLQCMPRQSGTTIDWCLRIRWLPASEDTTQVDPFLGQLDVVLATRKDRMAKAIAELEDLIFADDSPLAKHRHLPTKRSAAHELDLEHEFFFLKRQREYHVAISSSGKEENEACQMVAALKAAGLEVTWYLTPKTKAEDYRGVLDFMNGLNRPPVIVLLLSAAYLEPVPKTRYLKSGKLKNSGFAARLPFSSTFCRGVSFPSGFSHGNTIKVLPPPMGVRPVPSAGQFS